MKAVLLQVVASAGPAEQERFYQVVPPIPSSRRAWNG